MSQPVIFIGMHRSGTSMLGRLLENMGLFVGNRKDGNNEALFFLRINEWLMAQSGARWDTPSSMPYLWNSEELIDRLEEYVRYLMDSPRAIQFLGLQRYLFSTGISRYGNPWGWKDPRNTYTLLFWLRIFPKAKIISIERHGVDVAKSLLVRNQKGFSNATKKYKKYRLVLPVRPDLKKFMDSPRCATLEGGFSLWMEYMGQVSRVLDGIPEEQVLKLRYEHFLKDPISNLRKSAEFCGLNVSASDLKASSAKIDGGKAYSYRNDSLLCDFADKHKAELEDNGYTYSK